VLESSPGVGRRINNVKRSAGEGAAGPNVGGRAGLPWYGSATSSRGSPFLFFCPRALYKGTVFSCLPCRAWIQPGRERFCSCSCSLVPSSSKPRGLGLTCFVVSIPGSEVQGNSIFSKKNK
jgi:hypothetical protein